LGDDYEGDYSGGKNVYPPLNAKPATQKSVCQTKWHHPFMIHSFFAKISENQ